MSLNNVPLDMSSLSDSEEQTVSNIQNLQQIETDLYNTLENNLNNNMLTQQQQENIINKINEVSTMRLNLFNTLTSSYSFYQSNLTSSNSVLNNQITALNIANQQLNSLKIRLDKLMNKNINNRRLIEINTYYGKQYDAYSSVMKYILIICVPILILSILSSKNIIPENIYNLLVIIILIIGFVIVIRKVSDISLRDKMNFDEYEWSFNPSFTPGSSKIKDASNTSSSSTSNLCVGALCCNDAEMFDETLNLCVPIQQSNNSNNNSYIVEPSSTSSFNLQSLGLDQTSNCVLPTPTPNTS
jgi:hypothetical protein